MRQQEISEIKNANSSLYITYANLKAYADGAKETIIKDLLFNAIDTLDQIIAIENDLDELPF